MDSKLEEIARLGHKLKVLDENINKVKSIPKYPLPKIIGDSSMLDSGFLDKLEITISDELREPLISFLTDFFENKKEVVYDEMKRLLNK
jgi:hypothetical protein